METQELVVERHNAAATLRMRDSIEYVYTASHRDRIAADPFAHPGRFWERLVNFYSKAPAFEAVGGYVAGKMVGYAFGCTRPAARAEGVWNDIRESLPDFPVPQQLQPIFIFNEFAVHPDYRNRGYGRKLLDSLLLHRDEPVANLFVRPDNPARALYLAWGWRKVGEKKPFSDSPTYESLIKDLRSTTPSR